MLAATTLGLAGATGLAWLWRCQHQRAGERRERLFDRCRGLVASPSLVSRRPDYPVLRGRWRGCQAELRPVLDGLAVRKLPALWLQVSLLAPTGAPGTLDALSRPLGGEFWSPSSELEIRLATPSGLPETVQVRADHPRAASLLPALARQRAFLTRADAKEVLITPKGVRLVVLLAEADRGPYLLLRQGHFAVDRLDPDLARTLLDGAFGLREEVLSLAQHAAA